jgi:hypothetical protein
VGKLRVTPTMFAISPIERPRCRRCQLRMTLVAVEPAPARRDIRTFQCAKCERTETVIADDPMKSEKAGWLASELKPPQ